MVDEEDKKDDDSQNAFNPEGEAVVYLSLDQARVLAIQHARDNTDFYGRGYRRKELAWQVVSSEEGEDYHDIRLSFRPVHGFTGEPGVEHFLIDKAGPIRLRQILVEPKPRPRTAVLVVSGGLLVLLAGATVAVAIVSSAALEPEPVPTPTTAPGESVISLEPDSAGRLTSPEGDVTVDVATGAVAQSESLRYQPLTIEQLPTLPPGYSGPQMGFDLSVGGASSFTFNSPITVAVSLGRSVYVALTRAPGSTVVVLHYSSGGWQPLNTAADLDAGTATVRVDRLSMFALAVREPQVIATATVLPTETPVPTPTPSATPVLTPTRAAVPTPSPTSIPTPTATPSPKVSPSPAPTATRIPTETPAPTPTPTLTPTPTPTPSPTPTATATPTPTAFPTPSATPTPRPTATPAPPSSTWVTQNSGTDKTLYGVDAVDRYVAWAVGDGGVILKTINAGASWRHQTTTGVTLRDVAAVDVRTVWAVGDGGTILKTADGGFTWESQPSGSPEDLLAVSAVNPLDAWAVGTRTLLNTRDGGTRWESHLPRGRVLPPIKDISAVSPLVAWVVDERRVLKTTDAGFNWVAVGSFNDLRSVEAVDTEIAWVIGSPQSWKTTDGGATWQAQDFDGGLAAIDSNIAWALRGRGTILKTSDGGETWAIHRGESATLYDVAAIDTDSAWAVGEGGTIVHTQSSTQPPPPLTHIIESASVALSGGLGDRNSYAPAVSDDGKFVAFASEAMNLAPFDSNAKADIFVRHLLEGTTERVSLAYHGGEANGISRDPTITPDGRYVVFASSASNLVQGDLNGHYDIFVRDRKTGRTQHVSVGPEGEPLGNDSSWPSIGDGGRYVAFVYRGDEFPGAEANIIVHDRTSRKSEAVSLAWNGTPSDGASARPSVSADGRYVVYESTSSNLVQNDTNGFADVFVYDLSAGNTERVSLDSDGNEGDADSLLPSMSADGRHIVFLSFATNLDAGDNMGQWDVFVHDRQTGVTERASVGSDGTGGNGASGVAGQSSIAISGDGSFVVFQSLASNLVPDDNNGVSDIFVHDRLAGVTVRVSVDSAGNEGNGDSGGLSISADGHYVAFGSAASNLVPNDTNEVNDVFVAVNPLSPPP